MICGTNAADGGTWTGQIGISYHGIRIAWPRSTFYSATLLSKIVLILVAAVVVNLATKVVVTQTDELRDVSEIAPRLVRR